MSNLSNDWQYAVNDPELARNLLAEDEGARYRIIVDIRADLVLFGLSQGYSQAVIRGVVADLYRTFSSEIQLFIFAQSDDLSVAVTNDATLAWLNMQVAGKTIRERITERLV